MREPIICIGQQPNGFFPKRFFVSKIETAKKLQKEIGGSIVWFCHDSDSDYRETVTTLIDRQSGARANLNFVQENKIQKKFSPLYCKRIPMGWQEEISRKLPQYVNKELVQIFKDVKSDTVAGFCIRMYQKLGILEGVDIIRSSDPAVRRSAIEVEDFFVDTEYEGEIVRGRFRENRLELHEGGNKIIKLPLPAFDKEKISPVRDTRFGWMQSVINCTHYVLGASEKEYLNTQNVEGVNFVLREDIANPNDAYINFKETII